MNISQKNLFRQSITDTLKQNRPGLGESSLKTYTSTLYNLLIKVPGINISRINVKYFTSKSSLIMTYLEDIEYNKRKSILSALFVLTGLNVYNEKMKADMATSHATYKTQIKSETEEENWIQWDEVQNLWNERMIESLAILKSKRITDKNINTLNEFIALSCYTLIASRRIKDYSEMKIRKYNEETELIHPV